MGQRQNGIATALAHFIGCMRVARHDHMITSHTWSPISNWARGFALVLPPSTYCATALLKRGSITAGIVALIRIYVKESLRLLPNLPMSCSVLGSSSSHRMPHGEDACFLMSGLPSTMWDDVFVHCHRERKDVRTMYSVVRTDTRMSELVRTGSLLLQELSCPEPHRTSFQALAITQILHLPHTSCMPFF